MSDFYRIWRPMPGDPLACYAEDLPIAASDLSERIDRAVYVAITVPHLQRELLAILRGDHKARGAWASRAGIMGFIEGWTSAPLAGRMHEVKVLRERILGLEPDACIYATWGGPLPDDYVPTKTWAERASAGEFQ